MEAKTYFDRNGNPFNWIDYGPRLAEFRRKYPVDQGWSVSIERQYALDASPGLLEVTKCAIASNFRLADLGLSASSVNAVMFTAKLIDPSGRCVEMASSRQVVIEHKQHESGETAAMNRLLAKLGLGGGEVFAQDEAFDRAQQGITETPKSEAGAPSAQIQTSGSPSPAKAKRKGVNRQVSKLVLDACETLGRLGETTEFPVLTTNEEAKAWLDVASKRIEELKLTRPPESVPTVQ